MKDTVVEKTVETKSGNEGNLRTSELQAGEFVDHYEIKELLGIGGLARVYKAYDTKLGRHVALKMLRPGVIASEAARKRFQQEINLQANLSMTGCVSIFGTGEYSGMLYCVMEYVEGKTLQQILRDKGIDMAENLRILERVAKIVKELHRRGLEHRDIKPGNIIVNKYNEVILLDFGLAKAVEGETNICVTAHGQLFGTPAYMSPEQSSKQNNLYRAGCSDVYALGVLSFEMLTGRLPYAIDNLNLDEVFYVIRNEEPEPVSKYNKEVPQVVEKIINQALIKEPGARISINDFWLGLHEGNNKGIRRSPLKISVMVLAVILIALIASIIVIESVNMKSGKPEKTTPAVKSTADSSIIIPDIGVKLLKLPGVTFIMGSNDGENSAKPAHRVILDSFYIGEHEINGKQYAMVTESASKFTGDPDLPASVSWHDANKFCRLLTLREKKAGRLPEGMVYRLPTESEWEYACRAGSESKFFFGDMTEELPDYAVYTGDKKLKPGSRKPNKFGLYDTLGNVWEWCYDARGKYSALPSINPAVPGPSHIERIIRGGSAGSGIKECNGFNRQAVSPHRKDPLIGFRLALGHELEK